MAMYNLQANKIAVPQAVQNVINISVDNFLTAAEVQILFQHRNLFPVFVVTPAETIGLFRIRKIYFRDENVWYPAPNGHGFTTSGILRGAPRFNYTQAENAQLMRRTIRNQNLYGNNTFVLYL